MDLVLSIQVWFFLHSTASIGLLLYSIGLLPYRIALLAIAYSIGLLPYFKVLQREINYLQQGTPFAKRRQGGVRQAGKGFHVKETGRVYSNFNLLVFCTSLVFSLERFLTI